MSSLEVNMQCSLYSRSLKQKDSFIIGHFRVESGLCFKARLIANFILIKKIKLIFTRTVFTYSLVLSRNFGTREWLNGFLRCSLMSRPTLASRMSLNILQFQLLYNLRKKIPASYSFEINIIKFSIVYRGQASWCVLPANFETFSYMLIFKLFATKRVYPLLMLPNVFLLFGTNIITLTFYYTSSIFL